MTVQQIAQIIGIVAVCENLLIFISVKRERILVFKFISDMMWSVDYCMTGAYTAAFLNTMAMGRETVFYNRGHKSWASHTWWLFVFMGLSLISPVLEWVKAGGFTLPPLLPACGTLIAVFGFYNSDPRIIKICGFIANTLWLVYSLIIKNYPSTACCLLAITSSVIGLIREKKKTASVSEETKAV